jgi:putative FmdB family regulatory protein
MEVGTVPIYEYQCSECGEIFEAFQKISDAPLNQCRYCQGSVEKLISQSSFQLKGSGWYLTDYARKSQPRDSTNGSGEKSTPDKSEKKTADSGSKSSTTEKKESSAAG